MTFFVEIQNLRSIILNIFIYLNPSLRKNQAGTSTFDLPNCIKYIFFYVFILVRVRPISQLGKENLNAI